MWSLFHATWSTPYARFCVIWSALGLTTEVKFYLQYGKNLSLEAIPGSGKKFERSNGKKLELPKKSNSFPLELFSSNFFSVHMEAEVPQQWQTNHFKACSK